MSVHKKLLILRKLRHIKFELLFRKYLFKQNIKIYCFI